MIVICDNIDNYVKCEGEVIGLGCWVNGLHVCSTCYKHIKFKDKQILKTSKGKGLTDFNKMESGDINV